MNTREEAMTRSPVRSALTVQLLAVAALALAVTPSFAADPRPWTLRRALG